MGDAGGIWSVFSSGSARLIDSIVISSLATHENGGTW